MVETLPRHNEFIHDASRCQTWKSSPRSLLLVEFCLTKSLTYASLYIGRAGHREHARRLITMYGLAVPSASPWIEAVSTDESNVD
jgi:hypothetical protein